ncbi:MAG: hypothetical protein ABIJ09_10435 [Pseudomonadota bacterium]
MNSSQRRALCAAMGLAVLGFGTTACPHPAAVPESWWDAGTVTRPRTDAGAVDTGIVDALGQDARADDATTPDTTNPGDSSATDQGAVPADATASADASTSPDAATGADAAPAVDSGASVDAAAADAGYQHPGTWVVPSEHGAAVLQGTLDCTVCHAADLSGSGAAPSCDSCHSLIDPDWRTNCVFCHGGSDNQTGAPPHDLSHNIRISDPGVGAHSEHLAQATHQAVACADCHLVPVDVTSAGHMFDSTPGEAEVALAGLGNGGDFDGTGCTTVYCHGNGQVAGAIGDFTSFIDTCTACHASTTSTPTAQSGMSGDHASHLARGAVCAECHAQVLDPSGSFVGPTLHVNGVPDVDVTTGSYQSSTGDCTSSCHNTSGTRNWTAGGFHTAGWQDPANHGPALFDANLDCTGCHGADLTGGTSGVSCDSCHSGGAAWRTDCTFCHGGSDNGSGAPPVDLAGGSDVTTLTVGAHSEHLQGVDHAAVACTECHAVPANVLTPGHILDATPGVAEVDLGSGGISGGSYASAACNATYCHGNGQVTGAAPSFDTSTDLGCSACHNGPGGSNPGSMSGRHASHLARGASCVDCHDAVIDGSNTITGDALHVDGNKDVHLATGTHDSASGDCTTTCHTSGNPKNWTTGGAHPAGWAQESQHGVATVEGSTDCTSCHGADLTGGTAGVSCDDCHTGGTAAWRTDCTFCHGGTNNSSGAPPLDLHDATAVTVRTVGAHTEHLQGAGHAAVACGECHLVPATLLAPGHLFDATPNRAEVDLALAGISSGTYSSGSHTCAATYCHGTGVATGSTPAFENGTDLGCTTCHGLPNPWPHPQRTDCSSCHATVVNGSGQITGAAQHVDGDVDLTPYHPVGYDSEAVHGLAANLQTEDCRVCHGSDLRGGGATGKIPSCDSCHDVVDAAWRTNCTFCHGGSTNQSGAPPEDLRNRTTATLRTVGAHTEHGTETNHMAYSCSECHRTPVDVLSVNHMFDSTAGQAELVFNSLGAGNTLSDAASASLGATNTSCSNLYCHGYEGLDNGSMTSFTASISTCTACHPFMTSSGDDWQNRMSGEHKKHLDAGLGIQCWECHGGVVTHNNTNAIASPALHVNGTPNIQLVSGSFSITSGGNRRCSNVDCHGEDHGANKTW